MLAEVNNNSPRQLSFPTNEDSLSESTSSSKKEYSDPIQKLCMEKLLPELLKTGQPFMKFSRKENELQYPFLENSLWIDKHGNIFEQYHSKNLLGIPNTEKKHKGYAGEGDNKKVWDLKPLYTSPECPQMVRARFNLNWEDTDPDCEMSPRLHKRLKAFLDFGNTLDSKYLLIPEMIFTTNSKGKKVVYQMMPKAFADLSRISQKLSQLGKLRAARDVGLGLIYLHNEGCAHLHVKSSNIMMMNKKTDTPVIKLADFDMTMKLGESSQYAWRVDEYADPQSLNFKDCVGLESAKIHDQFGWGMVLCVLLTGYLPRKGFSNEELDELVREGDFIPSLEKSLILELNEALELKLNDAPDSELIKTLHSKVNEVLQEINSEDAERKLIKEFNIKLKEAQQARTDKVLDEGLIEDLKVKMNEAFLAKPNKSTEYINSMFERIKYRLCGFLKSEVRKIQDAEQVKTLQASLNEVFRLKVNRVLPAELIELLKSELSVPLISLLDESLQTKLKIALEFKASGVMQNIIRNCCIGPKKDRPYRLPEFVEIINEEISVLEKEIDESNKKREAEKQTKLAVKVSNQTGLGQGKYVL